MKNKSFQILFCLHFAATFFIVVVLSCNKKFDSPPAYIPPNISANATIQNVKQAHVWGSINSFTNDAIISGVVIANDSSGNFYKQIIIQDLTGGIAINIDDYNLYASFPIGRKIYVKLKGLYMADNGGLPYIGGSPDNGGAVSSITSKLLDSFVIKGEINVPVMPTVVTISDVKNNPNKYAYTLIRFTNFEVKEKDTAKTYAYATPTVKSAGSIVVKGCSSADTLVIRTSGYSYFANVNVPNGNGSLTAVYAFYKSPYNNKIIPQVVIRDTSDVQFINPRCNSVTPPVAPTITSIKNIRSLYNGSKVVLGAYQIGGIVISDAANKNIASGSIVLQDGDHGISVYLGNPVSYNVGDSVMLNVTGDTLVNYNGSLEVKMRKNLVLPAPVATNKTIAPAEVTIQQLNNSLSDIEFTLVKIKGATASGTSTYSGSQTVTDGSGNIVLYTFPSAVFASSLLPTNANDWVGYGSFNKSTSQFQIRNLNDVVNDTATTPSAIPDLLISEYIEGSSSNKYLEIYNAGSAAADLSRYKLKLYANGATSLNKQARLDTLFSSSTLPAGGIMVIQNFSASLPLPAGVTAHKSSVCKFNGDDAIALEKDNVVIDVFGAIGVDPGTSWTIANIATAAVDHSVRRKISVTAGNANWALSSSNEWIVGNKDDVSNLGVR